MTFAAVRRRMASRDLMTVRNRLRLSLLVLASVLFLGVAGFHYIEGWPWFDGLYMDNSALAGKSLADSDIRQKTGVRILALKHSDGSLDFNPAPEAVIRSGDCLIAIGGTDHLQKLDSLARG